jgi:ABC-type dipeptide/oligopeptide/nickel transport system permease subunit
LVAVDVADNPSHVVDVLVGVVGLVLSENLHDLATRLVTLGLAPIVLLADLLGFVGLEPSSSSLGFMLTASSNSSMTCSSLLPSLLTS